MHGEAAYPLYAYGHGWDEFESVKVNQDYANNNYVQTSPNISRKMSTRAERK